jgi:hypothetical protein
MYLLPARVSRNAFHYQHTIPAWQELVGRPAPSEPRPVCFVSCLKVAFAPQHNTLPPPFAHEAHTLLEISSTTH